VDGFDTRTVRLEKTLRNIEPLFEPLDIEYLRIDGNESIGVPIYWSYHPLRFARGRPSETWNFGGKGLSDLQSKVSMMAESIERSCATRVQNPELVRASLRELGDEALDPAPFGAVPIIGGLDAVQEWGYARSIMSGDSRLLHAGLLLHPFEPFVDVTPCKATFNGLSNGNGFHEALLHGLYELVERDAWVLFQALRPPVSAIDLDIAIPERLAEIIHWFERRNAELLLMDLSTDMPGHTFGALLFDRGFPAAPVLPMISGTHCDPVIALSRVLTEICQARANILFTKEVPPLPTTRDENCRLRDSFLAREGFILGEARVFSRYETLCELGLSSELAYMVEGLHKRGVDVFVSQLGVAACGFEVLRLNPIGLQPLTSNVDYLGTVSNTFSCRRTHRLTRTPAHIFS